MSESPKDLEKRKSWAYRATHGSHPTDLVLVKDFKYIVIRRAWIWAFVFVVAMGAFGLWSIHTNSVNDVKRAAVVQYHQDYNTCRAGNEVRATILELIRNSNIATQAIKLDPANGEALNALLRDSKVRSAENELKSEKTLAPRDCDHLFKKP